MKKYFKRLALLTLSISVIASLLISTLSFGFMPASADTAENTGWSHWGTADISGNETDGYNIVSESAFFVVSDSTYDLNSQGLSFKISEIGDKVDWLWFSVSKEDVSNKELYPTGNGADVSRVSFFIRKVSEAKAKITYCCANGTTIEGPNVIIDFDWSIAHTYSVQKTDSGDWYLFVDNKKAAITTASTHLNEFMNANAENKLRFGLGSPLDGVYFTEIKAVDITQPQIVNTWSYLFPHTSMQAGSLEGDEENGYSLSHTARAFALTDNKYDVTKYAVSLKLNSPIDNASSNGYFWFSLSRTHIEDSKIDYVATGENIGRITFMVWPEYSADTTKTRFSYINTDSGIETPIATVDKLDWSAEHSFGVTKDTDGNWYLMVDGAKVGNTLSNSLNTYLNTYGSALHFGVGGQKKFDGEKIKVISAVSDDGDGEGGNEPEQDGWGYWTSDSTGKLDGNETDGYIVNSEKGLFAISDKVYNVEENSLSLKLNSSDSWNGDGWFWLAVSVTDSADTEKFQLGTAENVNRICVLVHTNYNNSGQTRFSHINAYGDGKMTEKPIWTGEFDWSQEHNFCVSKAANGHWYWTVDGEQLTGAQSNVLDAFMELNAENGLRYGLGGQNKLKAENIKVINTGSVLEPGGWNFWSSNEVGKFDGNDTDGYSVNSEVPLYAITDYTYKIPENAVSLKLNTSDSTGGDGFFWFSITKSGTEDTSVTQYGEVESVNRMVFIVHTNYAGTGQTRFSYWNTDGGATEKPIWTNTLDWSGEHTLSVTKNADGHWYLTLDSMQLTGAMSANLDKFMELYADTDLLHFGIGGQNRFSAENINVVELGEVDEPAGWKYRSSIGNGEFSGDEKEGFSAYLEEGQLFAYTKKTYDVSKTAVEFEVTDVRDWIYFGISVTDREDTSPFPSGASASEINRFIFIITPTSGGNAARCSFWNPTDYSEEQIKTITDFNWYTTHTLDIRQGEGGGWYLCLDGMILMNKSSTILNEFIAMHNSNGNLRYALGGSGCFAVQGVKITEKPPLSTNSDGSSGSVSGVTDIGEIDFGFNYDTDDTDNSYTGDYDYDIDNSYDYNQYDTDNDFTFTGDYEFTNVDSDNSEIPEQIQVRYKKRKLVQKGHGIIFETWEIIAMCVGAVAVLSGIVFFIIFLLKRRKKRKIR